MRRPLSLRARIRLLVLGSVGAVLLLSAIPLTVLLHRAAADDARRAAIDTAQGVADYVSTSPSRRELRAYVTRTNAREDSPRITVVCSDGTVIGRALPDDAQDAAAGASDDAGTGPTGDDDGDGRFRPTSQVRVEQVGGGTLVVIDVRGGTAVGSDVVAAFEDDSRITAMVATRLGVAGLAEIGRAHV